MPRRTASTRAGDDGHGGHATLSPRASSAVSSGAVSSVPRSLTGSHADHHSPDEQHAWPAGQQTRPYQLPSEFRPSHWPQGSARPLHGGIAAHLPNSGVPPVRRRAFCSSVGRRDCVLLLSGGTSAFCSSASGGVTAFCSSASGGVTSFCSSASGGVTAFCSSASGGVTAFCSSALVGAPPPIPAALRVLTMKSKLSRRSCAPWAPVPQTPLLTRLPVPCAKSAPSTTEAARSKPPSTNLRSDSSKRPFWSAQPWPCTLFALRARRRMW